MGAATVSAEAEEPQLPYWAANGWTKGPPIWLGRSGVFPETEDFPCAIMDEVIPTKNYLKYIIRDNSASDTSNATSSSSAAVSASEVAEEVGKMTGETEKTMSNDEDNLNGRDYDKAPCNPERSREWFGVQLEVINLLLEAERRKLCVLQRELKIALEEGGSIKAKELQKQELIAAIQRIQLQYDNLEKECRQHAIGALKASNTRGTGKKKNEIKIETVASKSLENVTAEKLKSDNLESGRGTGPVQNGSTPEVQPQVGRNSEGKPKPPVPPKRSTLTYGKACSVPPPNVESSVPTVAVTPNDASCEPCHPLTSHLVTVTTNILSPVSKGFPTPKNKTQRVLSTFLPALPPKASKSPLVQSPNFPRYQNFDVEKQETKYTVDVPDELPKSNECREQDGKSEEEDVRSPPSSSTSKTSTSSTSISKISSSPTSTPAKSDADVENTPDKATPEFSPSQTPPPTPLTAPSAPQAPAKPVRKAVSKSDQEVRACESAPEAPRIEEPLTELNEEEKESESPPQTLYLEESNENTNTIKRAPANKDRLNATTTKTRTKSPIRVSFADEEVPSQATEDKLSRTRRATKELKNIIHQIEYSESDYCSDDNCRTCTVRKTSSLSRRRSVSPRTTLSRSFDASEGYTSCCEEDGRFASRKSKIAARRSFERKADGSRGLCSCPLDNFVIENRIPLSRPNSSIGDYCTDSKRSRSVGRVKKNSGSGIKTPFWNCGNYESPGLGLIVTISSDGIDKEPRRTVQFISGGPIVNFGLGGTLGRYTKSKSQDKSLKIAGNSFNSDRSASDFEESFEKNQEDQREQEKGPNRPRRLQETPKSIPFLQKQKSSGDLKEGYSNRSSDDFNHRYLSDTLRRNKSPGEVLEHFGKLATSVTTSEISKISNGKPETEIVQKSAFNQRHSHENFRTVPPASFNNPDPYQGSAFVQYIRETLPHQPNSLPSNPSSAFDKYIRPGSGRFDKSLILPQQPKSDKPSAFERLCGDKIYSSRRGIYGKKPTQTQSVSGSLDCVWNKPMKPVKVESEDESNVESDSRPASCTYEINRPVYALRSGGGSHPNYAVLTPGFYPEKEKAASGIPRTSKKGIIESETSNVPNQTVNVRVASPHSIRGTSPHYFNPRSLENYKLSPGFKTDLSTLYSGVFYANPKQDNSSSKLSSDSARILSEYGIKYYGTLPRSKVDSDNLSCSSEPMGTCSSSGRGTGSELSAGRKALTPGSTNLAATSRIPEEAPLGTTVTFPPQYHPNEESLMQDDPQSNRSQPAIGLKQTPKSRPTIFGTVASDQTPKDGSSRRSLPQTTLGSANGGAAEYSSSLESVQDSTVEKDNALVYRDGNLVSGSMEALVQHMVPTAEYYPDRAYLFAFLLSSRLFIKPHELLGEVCALCDSQQHLGGKDPPPRERLGRFIPHFVQLLAEWTETFPYDFRDERVMVHVRNITQKCVAVDPSIRKEVSTLLHNLLVRLTTLEKYEEFLMRISAENSTESLEGLSSTDVTELCASPGLLAQQLTHIELERLSYIGPEEFVQAFAKENPNLGTSFKDMKKTRNLESYVSWFNRLSYLVATEVCKHPKKKQRVRVMEYWIETARECFNIGNFNSLMAIIAGLNMSPVDRLKKTWSKIQSGKFSILEHQMDPSSNFSSYRSTLKAAMWRSAGATDQRQRIVIPFFSLLVKDLYFLNEGCSNKLPNGHINFEKFWQLAKQVTEFITWKQVACPFDKCTKVITFLQASPVLTENALALASFECEPPENNHEKERYKSLK